MKALIELETRALLEAQGYKNVPFIFGSALKAVEAVANGDLAGTLARVRSLLTDEGRLFIDIVDLRAAYLRQWSIEGAIKIDHPYYLTQDTMTAYLLRAGFEILRADYAADHLHVSYVCRPGAVRPDALPTSASVDQLLREIRFVQNAPRPGAA